MRNPLKRFAQAWRAWGDPYFDAKKAKAEVFKKFCDLEMRNRAAGFKSAESSRVNSNWVTSSESINTLLQRQLTVLRNRSRWVQMNVPNAVSAMNAFLSYCVGSGVHPHANVYDTKVVTEDNGNQILVRDENELWNSMHDEAWEEWAMNADVTGTETSPVSWYDVQKLALRKWIEDGEACVHIVIDQASGGVPISVEFFEPDALDLGININRDNGNNVVLGVELDKRTSRPVAYHVNMPDHASPLMHASKTERFPASDIIHLFTRNRPGQVRGYPWFHAVIDKFFQISEYEDAELLGVKIAACFSVLIVNASGVSPDGDLMPGNGSTAATDADGNALTHVQPGIIGNLPHGAEVHFAQPQKPGATYGMYNELNARATGAGIEHGMSYEALTRDTSKTAYAGGRMAQQMDFQSFRQIMSYFNSRFNVPFHSKWVDIAVLSGRLIAPGYDHLNARRNQTYWRRHQWIPAGWQFGINPAQEIVAQRESMRAGITTLADECAFAGRDWQSVLRTKAKIEKEAKRLGITLSSDASHSIMNGTEELPDEAGDLGGPVNNAATKEKD